MTLLEMADETSRLSRELRRDMWRGEIVPSEEWCRELRAILAEAEGLRRDPATEDYPDTTSSLGLEPRGGF